MNILIYTSIIYIFISIVFGNGTLPSQFSKVLLIGATIVWRFILPYKSKFSNSHVYIIWNILFAFFCLISVEWSSNPSVSLSMFYTVALMYICNICLYLSMNSCDLLYNAHLFIKAILLSALFFMLYFFLTNGVSFIGSSSREDTTVNLNTVGMICGFCICCLIYLYKVSDFFHSKTFNIVLGFVFSIIVLLSGSKKGLLLPIISLIIFNYINNSGGVN